MRCHPACIHSFQDAVQGPMTQRFCRSGTQKKHAAELSSNECSEAGLTCSLVTRCAPRQSRSAAPGSALRLGRARHPNRRMRPVLYGAYGYQLPLPLLPGPPCPWPSSAVAPLPCMGPCGPRPPLRFEAQDFVPTANPGPLFTWPGPCRACHQAQAAGQPPLGKENLEPACAASALVPPPGIDQDDLQSSMLQMQPRKPTKRLLNARLPPKGHAPSQMEVSDLPTHEWGQQALDVLAGSSSQLRCQGKEYSKAHAADDPTAAEESCKLVPEGSADGGSHAWRLLTRSGAVSLDAAAQFQVDPVGSCPTDSEGSEISSVLNQNSDVFSEFTEAPLHGEVAGSAADTDARSQDYEEKLAAMSRSSCTPLPRACSQHDDANLSNLCLAETSEQARLHPPGCKAEGFQADDGGFADAAESKLEAPLPPLPFQTHPGNSYDRGWVKYRDPDSEEVWFHNEFSQEFFYAQYSREKGWSPFQCDEGQRWWWHGRDKRFFFEGLK